jgi:hypothetical protein
MCGSNSRQQWKTVKSLIGLKSKDTGIDNYANNEYNGDMKRLVTEVNDAFVSVSQDLTPLQCPTINTQPIPDEFIITVDYTERQLMKIKTTKASGPDQIPNWILKDLAALIAKPVCAIWNSSLREGFTPELWRSADICPVPKTNPIINIRKDLRPISLTPILAKLLEHHPVKHMRNTCPNIDPTQYGGVKGSSVTHALLRILQPIYKAVDNSKNFARLLLIDFSKAFDHIDQEILINKLVRNGVHPVVCNWYRGFLHSRKQRVKVGHSLSDWRSVNGGVPQGTLSGPDLFIHMVSDLKTSIPDVKFMDDTTMIEIKKKKEPSEMQKAAGEVETWSTKNKLGINSTKTKDMLVSFGNEPIAPLLTINGVEIDRVKETKLLGTMISSDLKWNANTYYINRKASKRLHYLRCLKRSGLARKDLLRVYLSLIRSVCEFACQVWATSLTQELCHVFESIQKRAVRIILPNVEYQEACLTLNIPLLKARREELCKQFYEKMQNPDHKLHDMLPESLVTNARSSLRENVDLPLPQWKTKRYKDSYIPWCLYNCQDYDQIYNGQC